MVKSRPKEKKERVREITMRGEKGGETEKKLGGLTDKFDEITTPSGKRNWRNIKTSNKYC